MSTVYEPMHFKQRRPYTCGPAALRFFMWKHGLFSSQAYSEVRLADRLGTSPERGTDPWSIEAELRLRHFPFIAGEAIPFHMITLPMIVNYFDGEDGHYGVITELRLPYSLLLWDPFTGDFKLHKWEGFLKNWYSPRYGKHWGLCKIRE